MDYITSRWGSASALIGSIVVVRDGARLLPGRTGVLQRLGVGDMGESFAYIDLGPSGTHPVHVEDVVKATGTKVSRANKHGAIAVEVDGNHFKSTGEARRYEFLRTAQLTGVIRGLRLQPAYLLQPKFIASNASVVIDGLVSEIIQGFPCSCVTYRADFLYIVELTGVEWVEDWKSLDRKKGKPHITKDSMVTIRHFLHQYPLVNFVINTDRTFIPRRREGISE